MSFAKIVVLGRSAIRFLEANLLVILFLIGIFALSVNQLQEHDAWYHLKTGEYIVTHLTVPTHDIFSYTAPGVEWVTHSWLPEVIFFLIYKLSGLWGLIFFCAFMAAVGYALVIRLANLWVKNKYVTLFSLFAVPFLRVSSLWVPRPQIFSYILLLVELLILENYLGTKNKKYLIALPVLFLLWANMHASVLLGLVILAYYVFFARELWPYALGSLAISFLSPNTYHVFTYQFAINEVVKVLRVGEWASVWEYRPYMGAQMFFVLLALINLWCVGSALRKRTARDLRFAGLMLGFSVLPFISVRHIGYFPLMAFPILAVKLGETNVIASIFSKLSIASVKFVLVFFTLLFAIAAYLHWPKTAVSEVTLPVKAVDFIEREGVKGPMFNYYNEGGYLIWRLWPREYVFFDGRSEVYRGKPLYDYVNIIGLSKYWAYLVDQKYHINYFLFPRLLDPTGRYTHAAITVLTKYKFKPVYADPVYIVFVRDSKENAALIKKFAIDPKMFLDVVK